MPTRQKARTIDELSDQLTRAKLVIVTDYRGLKVAICRRCAATCVRPAARSTSPRTR